MGSVRVSVRLHEWLIVELLYNPSLRDHQLILRQQRTQPEAESKIHSHNYSLPITWGENDPFLFQISLSRL